MKSLVDHLASYASYHRDHRNVISHFIGIPSIVLGTQVALARIPLGPINGAVAATAAASAYYIALDRKYGLVMTGVLGASCALATALAKLPRPLWAATAGTLFVGGWAAQAVGHIYEGKKPAFVDDLIGLLIGPLFLAAETAFALGLSKDLQAELERRVRGEHGADHLAAA